MVKKKRKKRNYKKEYRQYHSKPLQRKRRSQRNKARRKMVKQGRAKKGDGKDVHHRNHNTGDNSKRNIRVIKKSKNRAMNKKKKR